MAIYPDDLDLAPFEDCLRQCLGNAAVAIRGRYQQDVTALVNEVKRLRVERDILLTGVKGEPISATPDPMAEITKPPVPSAPSAFRAPVAAVSNIPLTSPTADQVSDAESAAREEQGQNGPPEAVSASGKAHRGNRGANR